MYLLLVQPLTGDSTSDSHVINIAEIEAYDMDGTKLTLSVDSYSSQASYFPVTDSIDGSYTNFAHTFWEPVDLTYDNWFKYSISGISDICLVQTIKVYNRQDDCCKYRIVGDYLQLLADRFVVETFSFDQQEDEYTFSVYCNFTGLCVFVQLNAIFFFLFPLFVSPNYFVQFCCCLCLCVNYNYFGLLVVCWFVYLQSCYFIVPYSIRNNFDVL